MCRLVCELKSNQLSATITKSKAHSSNSAITSLSSSRFPFYENMHDWFSQRFLWPEFSAGAMVKAAGSTNSWSCFSHNPNWWCLASVPGSSVNLWLCFTRSVYDSTCLSLVNTRWWWKRSAPAGRPEALQRFCAVIRCPFTSRTPRCWTPSITSALSFQWASWGRPCPSVLVSDTFSHSLSQWICQWMSQWVS